MNILEQIAISIIKEQERIIGPLSWIEAAKVSGLKIVSQNPKHITIENNAKDVINDLVAQYERLFGKISHDICKEAAHELISQLSQDDIPSSLK